MDADAFVTHFAEVFESSPWVARGAWASRPWSTVDELHAAMVAVVDGASEEQRRDLLRAHPDLSRRAGRPATLTASSSVGRSGSR